MDLSPENILNHPQYEVRYRGDRTSLWITVTAGRYPHFLP